MALVEVDRRERGIVLVTLNDPDRRNAMTVEMGEAIAATFSDLAGEDDLRVVVLTGAPPAFSAGGDLAMLEDFAERTRDEGFDATDDMRRFYERFLAVRDVPVPVIAAINGHAVGAGLCVALACDLALVADDAKVGLNFARLALHPGMGGSWLLPRVVGTQRAAELLYTGRLASGTEMAQHGLALESLPASEVLSRALDLAGEIAASAPLVVRQLKRSLAVSPTNTLPQQLDLEAANQAVNYGTEDLAEGLAAGRERRRADFTGR
ncbi:MAG: enoyl-CoA hydratase/isomerase family protein [Actinobacteria bacterium]|nr:enoyl-CoA hydratase/isomerase family protein [Actinomycetota bacterium]